MPLAALRSIPKIPLALGLAGLLPFWGLAVALSLHGALGLREAPLESALATYAAIIASFLGGIRWGLAVAAGGERGRDYALAVVPSLLAWALLMAPEPWRLGGLGLLLLALGPLDLMLVRDGLAPQWFGRLRLILSTGAGVALLLGLL